MSINAYKSRLVPYDNDYVNTESASAVDCGQFYAMADFYKAISEVKKTLWEFQSQNKKQQSSSQETRMRHQFGRVTAR